MKGEKIRMKQMEKELKESNEKIEILNSINIIVI